MFEFGVRVEVGVCLDGDTRFLESWIREVWVVFCLACGFWFTAMKGLRLMILPGGRKELRSSLLYLAVN